MLGESGGKVKIEGWVRVVMGVCEMVEGERGVRRMWLEGLNDREVCKV